MTEPIFDAVFALCTIAEEEGFHSVADALELVLDVYLLERGQKNAIVDPTFKSNACASQIAVQIADVDTADVDLDAQNDQPLSSPPNKTVLGWTMTNFPLLYVN